MHASRPLAGHHVALLALCALVFATYSVVVPIWEAPDEYGHFYYAHEIARDGRLPVQRDGGEGEAHQPPGYYALVALPLLLVDLNDRTGDYQFNRFLQNAGMGGQDRNFSLHGSAETFPWRGLALGFHLARLLSALLAVLALVYAAQIVSFVFPGRPQLVTLSVGLVAFNPQFAFISGVLNNDTLLTLAATAAMFHTLRAMASTSTGHWLAAAVWVAIGALAKLSIISIALWVALAFCRQAWAMRNPGFFLGCGALMMLIIAAPLAPWLLRNQMLYGDVLGYVEFSRIFAWAFRSQPFALADVPALASYAFRSFWGLFGWINIPVPDAFIVAMLALTVVGIAGFVRSAKRVRSPATAWLMLAVAMHVGYFVANALRMDYTWHQGRYLFPVIVPMMMVLAVGLSHWLDWRAQRLALAGMALFALACPFMIIQPAYNFKWSPKWSLWFAPNPVRFVYGDQIELVSHALRCNQPATCELALMWRAVRKPDFDYSSFVHVVDRAGNIVAQADQGPGRNLNYTPQAWQIEDIVRDTRTIELPRALDGTMTLRIGVYNWSNNARLGVIDHAGAFLGDYATVSP